MLRKPVIHFQWRNVANAPNTVETILFAGIKGASSGHLQDLPLEFENPTAAMRAKADILIFSASWHFFPNTAIVGSEFLKFRGCKTCKKDGKDAAFIHAHFVRE